MYTSYLAKNNWTLFTFFCDRSWGSTLFLRSVAKTSTALVAHLSCLFTSMLHIGHVPAELKKGIIITILKDRHKSLSSPNNYRGITLLPVFYKLLERILLARIQKYISLNSIRFPDQLQFAYQPKLSSLHASFTLQEAINYNLELGAKVYTCLLDTSKAFDVVWINGLFYKLYTWGICGNMWHLLYMMPILACTVRLCTRVT